MSDTVVNLPVSLSQSQLDIYNCPVKYIVVNAGRRGGKTYVGCLMLLREASITGKTKQGLDLEDIECWFVGLTRDQTMSNAWPLLKKLGKPIIKQIKEKEKVIVLKNNRRIRVVSADAPSSLQGAGIQLLVMDEMDDQKFETFNDYLDPMLTDTNGRALFIGRGMSKNTWFYELYEQGMDENNPYYKAFSFLSTTNPFISHEHIEIARQTMAPGDFRIQYEASWEDESAGEFQMAWFEQSIVPFAPDQVTDGYWVVIVDLAGFSTEKNTKYKSQLLQRDETAIAKVCVHSKGWFAKEIETFRKDPRETIIRILMACREVGVVQVGIERGSLQKSLEQNLLEKAAEWRMQLEVVPLNPGSMKGGNTKQKRILWSLSNRFRSNKIQLLDGPWLKKFRTQYQEFPSHRAHDDMLDALAFVDQMGPGIMMAGFSSAIMRDNLEPTYGDEGH